MPIVDYRPWPLTLLLLMPWVPSRAQITITNNAYSGILVAIEDSVDEDPNLIQGIRNAFTEASQALYDITGKRAYFSSVSILVPPSWPDDLAYEAAGNERFDNSDFRILNSFPENDAPSVFHPSTVCGESGGYGRFAPGHFTNAQSFAQQFGTYGKEIVYQWARIRFGVFDESPQNGEPELYPVENGEDYEGSRCSLQIPGQKKKLTMNGLEDCDITDAMNNLCIFIPTESVTGKFASLMYSRRLNHVTEFCDESGSGTTGALIHNPVPTNAQNTNCQVRSVWEVIRDHPDYGEMDPSRQGPSTVPSPPTFRILRSRPSSIVLVLDTSGSMGGPRIQKLSQGVTYFLQSVVQNGIEVGMVRFSSGASTLQSVSKMSGATRQQFIDAVPIFANGGTSIGAGIERALELLQTANIHGGTLIVVSDGQENAPPLIVDVTQDVLAAGVRIDTVAISDAADTGLEALALLTGGNAYFSLDNDTSNAITEAFLDIGESLNTGNVSEPEPIALYSESSTLDPNGAKMDSVIIDATLGLNTEITFDYASSAGVEILLRSPMGQSYDITSNECTLNSNIQIITCHFQNSETGEWQYTVTNKASHSQRISVIFRSQPRDPTDPPIVARAFWAITGTYTVVPGGPTQRLFATVSKGLNPVLSANVIATVESSTGSPVMLNLKDNGAGADLNQDDGIYSAFFVSFNADGRYTVKVSVDSTSATTTSLQTILGIPPPASSSNAAGRRKRATSQTTGQFQRVASGGTFRALGTANLTSTPYPPGRITNLRVLSTDTTQYRVTLQWTAQGEKLDVGAAAEYEIRRGYERNLTANYSVIMSGDVVQGNLSAPATAGTVENFVIQLPTEANTFYVGVIPKAADATPADLSNVVSFTTTPITLASLGVAPPQTTVPGVTSPAGVAPPRPTVPAVTSPAGVAPPRPTVPAVTPPAGRDILEPTTSTFTIGVASGFAALVVVCVALGVMIACCCQKDGPCQWSRGPDPKVKRPGATFPPTPRVPMMASPYRNLPPPARPPTAYYANPYAMGAAYQNQAFLSTPQVYASQQSMYPPSTYPSTYGYSNVTNNWYSNFL